MGKGKIESPFPVPLAPAVQFQGLHNGFLHFLGRRPRWEEFGDSLLGHLELLHLVRLFLLHNGNNGVPSQALALPLPLRQPPQLLGLGVGGSYIHFLNQVKQFKLLLFSQVG